MLITQVKTGIMSHAETQNVQLTLYPEGIGGAGREVPLTQQIAGAGILHYYYTTGVTGGCLPIDNYFYYPKLIKAGECLRIGGTVANAGRTLLWGVEYQELRS